MAKKRRVRRKAKRALKKSKARSRRRRNPSGNFKLPTPRQAIAYINAWKRKKTADGKNITKASMIKLDSERETKLAQLRWREADKIRRLYAKALEKYEADKAAFDAYKKQGVKKVGDIPLSKLKPRKPNADGKVRDEKGVWGGATGGNFRAVTAKQAENYLKRHFGYTKVTSGRSHSLQSAQYPFTPRMNECVEVLGLEKATKIVADAKAAAERRMVKKAQADLKKVDKKVNRNESAVAKAQKELEKRQAALQAALEQQAALRAAAPKAKAAATSARKKFRRNPVGCGMNTKKTGSRRRARKSSRKMSRAKKAKKSRKMKKAKKAKKSRKMKKAKKAKKSRRR